MAATRPTTIQQRQEIGRLAAAGLSYSAIATRTGLSVWTVRKWARRAKQAGQAGLVTQWGRPASGPLVGFEPLVAYVALRLKRQHPTWGAVYVVKKMSQRASLKEKKLPEATTVGRYWRRFGDRLRPPRHARDPQPAGAGVAHGVWQMDAKESVSVVGVGTVTFNQARDEFGRATVMHRIHPAPSAEQQTVKLTSTQVQQDCRIAFRQWGLPDAIQTDRAAIYVDADPNPFPTWLTLWWVGLGIEHRLIPRHTPERNGWVERSHRTLNERTLVGQHFNGAEHLQTQVDADGAELNAECPSRAKGCHGQPPLVAHPELLVPRRAYCPEAELDRFDLKRVDRYLASQTWTHTVSQVGQVSLGGDRYGLGKAWAGQTVAILFEPEERHFVFTQVMPCPKRGRLLPTLTPVSLPSQGLTVEALTGLALTPENLSGP